jgi:hypothetical protein
MHAWMYACINAYTLSIQTCQSKLQLCKSFKRGNAKCFTRARMHMNMHKLNQVKPVNLKETGLANSRNVLAHAYAHVQAIESHGFETV